MKITLTTTIQIQMAVVVVVADVRQHLLAVVPERLNLNVKQVLAANGQLVKDAVAGNVLWLGVCYFALQIFQALNKIYRQNNSTKPLLVAGAVN
jgi:hypothetical protein